MGYVIVLILGAILLVVAVVVLSKQGPKAMKGQLPSSVGPVGQNQPSADEPTPGASSTSSPAKVQAAQQHTPPA